ncbi:MAG: response regulator [Rhizonema sp. PD38]|nr:response regulator [Rhizonema sp. PD38]
MFSNFCDSHQEKDREFLNQTLRSKFRLLDGLRLLIVDDNIDTLKLITIIFEEYQVRVRTAVSVDEAIEVIQEWKPDVLISDICLPGKDGYSLIRYIRSLEVEERSFLPAVALTGYVFPEDYIQAFNAGFQKYIPKPFDPDELVAVVAELTIPIFLSINTVTKNAA